MTWLGRGWRKGRQQTQVILKKAFSDMDLNSHRNLSPKSVRQLCREKKLDSCSTSGMCQEYLQANVAIIHENYASDFRKFVDLNSGPCPLLYQSKPGEVGAPLLADNSDIRTDLPGYKVYIDGASDQVHSSLLDHDWGQMVTFYLGCSFSFEERLRSAGIPIRNIEEGKNVSMYSTDIQCLSAGPFGCNMVVSMRPIPRALLDKTVNLTLQMDFAHGAPVHIGNPMGIGITDLHGSETIGDTVTLKDGDIPVFWACGVTSGHAVSSARLPTAFSHSPGCMFIADKTVDETRVLLNTKTYPEARTICLHESQQIYSTVSHEIWDKISRIEKTIIDDPGNRGVKPLQEINDLHCAALSITQSAKSVAILTGFPCFPDQNPMIENDGISGAISIARAVQALGKPVTFIVGNKEKAIFKDILIWSHSKGILNHEVSVVSYDNAPLMLYDELTDQKRFSHLISIERAGRNSQGKYCTMNNRDISDVCDPVDELFIEAKKHPDIVTIGIGDGGNEIGMGKVLERVVANVKIGSEIACTISCDYLITAGVSNWGGYALAKAIFLCASCPVHDRYRRKGLGHPTPTIMTEFVASVDQEKELLEYQSSLGIRDGINRQAGMSVDGIDFIPYHANKITDIAHA